MNLFPRRNYFLLVLLDYLMNLFARRSYFLLASLNYLMNVFPRRSYFLLASLNYLMNVFPRRSYFLLASLDHLPVMKLFPRRDCFLLVSRFGVRTWKLTSTFGSWRFVVHAYIQSLNCEGSLCPVDLGSGNHRKYHETIIK